MNEWILTIYMHMERVADCLLKYTVKIIAC